MIIAILSFFHGLLSKRGIECVTALKVRLKRTRFCIKKYSLRSHRILLRLRRQLLWVRDIEINGSDVGFCVVLWHSEKWNMIVVIRV